MAVRDKFALSDLFGTFCVYCPEIAWIPHSRSHLPTGREMRSAPSTFTLAYRIPFMAIHACMQGIGRVDVVILSTCTPVRQCYALLIRWQGCMSLVRHHVASQSWYYHELSSQSCWASVTRQEGALPRGTQCLFVAQHFGSAMTAAWRSRKGN